MRIRIFIAILALAVAAFSQAPPIEPGVSHELAKWRAARYSDVRYKLNLTLEKMSPVLKGTMEIRISHSYMECTECPPLAIILDWRKIKGSESLSTISNVSINDRPSSMLKPGEVSKGSGGFRTVDSAGKIIPDKTPVRYEERDEHLIFQEGVEMGENVIKLDFTSPILTSGSAITRYVDKEDGAEYIYSLFVPSDASTAFPVFDQPDLKARYRLEISGPTDWSFASNAKAICTSVTGGSKDGPQQSAVPDPNATPADKEDLVNSRQFLDDVRALRLCKLNSLDRKSNYAAFQETKPISTYVFAFAAGPFEPFADKGGNLSGSEGAQRGTPSNLGTLPTGRVSASNAADLSYRIFVRKSQAAKFKPHAAEVFRLNREGIKFLESYFDYKFPFPKYDIVLIPEFPFGGMEHAGATFLRESSVIFPQEPTKNDYISRANVIFHEAAHQWFGDTVTMKWFDDLWLKEGFAEFMAYKTLEKVMPEYNAWKVFYERNKQAAYLTDSTKGTTPIYHEIANLNSAKSAYGNIVYRKAPSFLRQAEFYLGPDKFQAAVRAFLKKHEYANAGWEDLVTEFQATIWGESREADSLSNPVELQRTLSGQLDRRDIKEWATVWVNRPGLPILKATEGKRFVDIITGESYTETTCCHLVQQNSTHEAWPFRTQVLVRTAGQDRIFSIIEYPGRSAITVPSEITSTDPREKSKSRNEPEFFFGNYGDYGYGIFLLDDKSRDYVLKNIGSEKDDFLRTMMWGSLWDSVREGELDPKEYVELVLRVQSVQSSSFSLPSAAKKQAKAWTLNETDESTIQTLLSRVSTAMNYYVSDAERTALAPKVEALLIDKMQNASTPGQKITYYRSFLNIASSENARRIMKVILKGGNPSSSEGALGGKLSTLPTGRVSASTPKPAQTTKDRFDLVSKLIILGDPEAPKLLADLEKTETSDEAKRYAYAAKAGFATAENKAKFWTDFVSNKDISESWIEAAFGPFNNVRHSALTLPYLEKALAELPNLKRSRKIFFVNGWLGAFIGGQKSEAALAIVNKFLADNPNLDKDLRLKILENVDLIERAVRIRGRFGKS